MAMPNSKVRAAESSSCMYYTVEMICWCIALHRECWMRLTYRREVLAERNMVADFLVSAEPMIAAPIAR